MTFSARNDIENRFGRSVAMVEDVSGTNNKVDAAKGQAYSVPFQIPVSFLITE